MLQKCLWLAISTFLLVGVAFAGDDCTTDSEVCSESVRGLSNQEIQAIEVVDLDTLPTDYDLMNDRWYKRVNGTVDVYDTPNGNVTRKIDAGFNFVTVLTDVDDWTQINPNEWVKNETVEDINGGISAFTGVFLPKEKLEYQIAWALVNMYPSQEPGETPRESLGLIYRYTLLTIYAQVNINGESWYQIGADKWVHQFNVAKIHPLETLPEGVESQIWVGIDLYEQVLIAYDGTTPVFTTLIASGLPRWETQQGIFHIYYRNPREYMSWGTVGDDYYSLEEVPWTMFFDEGRALHGAYWHDGFGYRRSHGCVNMSISDAKWLYDWVADFMGTNRSADVEIGPNVYVYSSGEYKQ